MWAATLASSLALLLLALLRPFRQQNRDRAIDLSLMAVSCTMASPIAWEHHYGVTLPIYAVMLATCLGDRTRLIWLGISYALVSTYVPVTNLLAGGPLNVLQSTLFAGAIILLVLLVTGKPASSGMYPRPLHVRR